MTPTAFIDCLDMQEVPPYPLNFDVIDFLKEWKVRDEITSRGMWALIDKVWTQDLAKWVGDRKCLEVMAGHGWLAKALEEHGVDIIATDDFTWVGNRHSRGKPFDLVKAMTGLDAVKLYDDAEVLIVSWPPYEDEKICAICEEWGPDRPIIYIGEGGGGCTATDTFHEHFWSLDDPPYFEMQRWDGIHDHVEIGHYKP